MSIFKLVFKRVRIIKGTFRRICATVTPKEKENLENKYKAEGILDFKDQTLQVSSSQLR